MIGTWRSRWEAGLALGFLLAAGCTQPVPAGTVGGLTVHGRADYDWTIQTPAGERVRLEAYRGRVLFINMWASWCAPCVAEMGSIQRLHHSLRDTEVEFLLVSPEQPEPVERFLRRYGYDLPVFLEAGEMPAAFGLRALPTTFVVDRSGNIVLKHRGAADWDDNAVRAFLQSLTQ